MWIYDIECYRNYLLFVFLKVNPDDTLLNEYIDADTNGDKDKKKKILSKLEFKTFEFTEDKNSIVSLSKFVKDINILVGYNSINYDNNILDKLIYNKRKYLMDRYNTHTQQELNKMILEDSYSLSTEIIENLYNRYLDNNLKQYKANYTIIDLQKLLYLDKAFVSLKQMAISMNWYRIQDLPIKPDREIEVEEREEIIDYCRNDVLITYFLCKKALPEIKQRIDTSTLYKVNVISQSRSSTADRLFTKFYIDYSGLRYNEFSNRRTERRKIKFADIISSRIEFKTPELKAILDKFRSINLRVGVDKFEEEFNFRGTMYKVATGGLHSVDRPGIFTSTNKIIYRDADVSSFYPRVIINEEISPKHLNKHIFVRIITDIVTDRLIAKANKHIEGNETKADALKIVINAVFGKLGFELGWLYDLAAMYQTTVNGQLYLLMLVEMLEENGIRVVSANTDGIISRIPVEKEEIYNKVCEEWSKRNRFELEYVTYSKYIRKDVNNYMSITTEGKIKKKGIFIDKPQIDKIIEQGKFVGYAPLIIAKTLNEYYLNGIRPSATIKNGDIYDYCMAQKTGNQFETQLHDFKNQQYIIDNLQKSTRYFVSTDGGRLLKKYKDSSKTINILKGERATIFNNYFKSDNYNINYNYYLKEVLGYTNLIDNIVYSKMKSNSNGGLFTDADF